MPRFLNVDEVESMSHPKGRCGGTARRSDAAAGTKAIGFNGVQPSPGKTTFPYHYHTEKGIYLLSGKGDMRIGEDTGESLTPPALPSLRSRCA
jgi:uncharacterized cupin superfamily protein